MTRNLMLGVTLLLGSGAIGCGPHLKIDARVVSCTDKKPIDAAQVHYSLTGTVGASATEEHTKKTAADGRFRLGAVNFPEDAIVNVRIEHRDYQTEQLTWQGSQPEEQEVCLKKKSTK